MSDNWNSDLSSYDRTIQRFIVGVDDQALKKSLIRVVEYVRESDCDNTEKLSFQDTGKRLGDEFYKYDIFEKAYNALSFDDWKFADIGSGRISKCVIEAMAYTDNLVNRRFVIPEFIDRLKDQNRIEKNERVLFEIYRGTDEEKAFNDATECFGFKYPLIAYLFFIKDKERFLPTSPDRFDACFEKIGISFRMSKRCSWDNYCEFIAIIKRLQEIMNQSGLCDHEASLVDAHSLIWVMNNLPDTTPIDINTPVPPERNVEKDGVTKYLCPSCGFIFVRAERCPECGQLIEYNDM